MPTPVDGCLTARHCLPQRARRLIHLLRSRSQAHASQPVSASHLIAGGTDMCTPKKSETKHHSRHCVQHQSPQTMQQQCLMTRRRFSTCMMQPTPACAQGRFIAQQQEGAQRATSIIHDASCVMHTRAEQCRHQHPKPSARLAHTSCHSGGQCTSFFLHIMSPPQICNQPEPQVSATAAPMHNQRPQQQQ